MSICFSALSCRQMATHLRIESCRSCHLANNSRRQDGHQIPMLQHPPCRSHWVPPSAARSLGQEGSKPMSQSGCEACREREIVVNRRSSKTKLPSVVDAAGCRPAGAGRDLLSAERKGISAACIQWCTLCSFIRSLNLYTLCQIKMLGIRCKKGRALWVHQHCRRTEL